MFFATGTRLPFFCLAKGTLQCCPVILVTFDVLFVDVH